MSCGQPFRGQKTLNIPPIRPPSSPEPLAGGAGQAHALSGGDLPAGQICCHENQAVLLLLRFISCRKTPCLCVSAGASLECQVSEGKQQILGSWSTVPGSISTHKTPGPTHLAHTPPRGGGPPPASYLTSMQGRSGDTRHSCRCHWCLSEALRLHRSLVPMAFLQAKS